MKTVELSVAGKTFVAGEYLALQGGAALILSTKPRFSIKASKPGQSRNPFHSDSPAGKFWLEKKDYFQDFYIEFSDPYEVGGFGASSAQFALLHALWQLKDAVFNESERFFDWHDLLQDYRRIGTVDGRGPSGADVVGVCSGGLTLFERSIGKVQMFSWPFQDIEFFISHTGRKLATHEHLRDLPPFETENFEKAMLQIQTALSQVDFAAFISGLRSYRQSLEAQNLVASHTREKVQNLEASKDILFAKGCGAMGSDVILSFCRKDRAEAVLEILQREGLKVLARSEQISSGLEVRNLTHSTRELSL